MITDQRIQKYIWDIVHKLRQAYQPERIILFGSYVYGQPHADSDIDMLIIKDTHERSIDRLVRAQGIAFNWQRDVPFDPIVYTPQEVQQGLSTGDALLREIFEKGVILYSSSPLTKDEVSQSLTDAQALVALIQEKLQPP